MNIHTLGIDLSPGMIDVAKNNYPDIEFKVGNIINFKLKNKVDFINCSFDTINHLVDFKDWDYLFKNVKNNLNEKGFFLFDFVTEQKLKNCVSTQFKTNENYDCVNEIRIIEKNKVEINKTYYIKEDNRYKKINQKIVEAVFRTDDVFDLLRKNNFRVLFKLNKSLQITNNSNSNRMYVLCQKC